MSKMMKLNKVKAEKPTLILDKERVLRNIQKMAEKAQRNGVRFRPHFKTHQSAQIGEWFRKFGVSSITVSSVDMADYFSKYGWKDITIAFPVNIREINKINALAQEITLHLLVESKEAAYFLRENLKCAVNVWIEIDTGNVRTGIPHTDSDKVVELAHEIEKSPYMSFRGLLTFAGHSYRTRSIEQIKQVHHDSVGSMNHLRDILKENGFSAIQLSVGDTPTCSIGDDFSRVDEIRPGTFIFNDIKQLKLGSCTEKDIAVVVACPVVAKYKERNEIIIYGGAAYLSKDFIERKDGTKIFGLIALPGQKGWGPSINNTYISSVTQEHGIVKTDDIFFDKIKIGDILMVIPLHCCLTVNLMRIFHTLDGELIEY